MLPRFLLWTVSLCTLALALAAAVPVAVSSPAELLDRASTAEDLGLHRAARWLTRRAAHAGSLRAALDLARLDTTPPAADWLTPLLGSPEPAADEARAWRLDARATAARLAAAGDVEGDAALGFLLVTGPRPVARDSVLLARRFLARAADGGRTRALVNLAVVVWDTDGPIAAEPLVRRALARDLDTADRWNLQEGLRYLTFHRPAIAAGRPATDEVRWTDAVAEGRLLWQGVLGGNSHQAGLFYDRVRTLETAARAGDADADSLLSAFCTARLGVCMPTPHSPEGAAPGGENTKSGPG